MIRRSFLVGAAATAAAGGLATLNSKSTQSQGPERAERQFELNMVTTWPQNFPGLGTSAERFARRVEAASRSTQRVSWFPRLEPSMRSSGVWLISITERNITGRAAPPRSTFSRPFPLA